MKNIILLLVLFLTLLINWSGCIQVSTKHEPVPALTSSQPPLIFSETLGEYKPAEKYQFKKPMGIAVDIKGNVYVADTNNDRIQKFNEKGELIYIKAISAMNLRH